jgi:hypothetical protein
MVTRKSLEDLASEESDFFEAQLQEIMRRMYPAELPLRVHPHLDMLPKPRKPTLRERLARATYPLRARLASWLVGWDVTADQDDY